MMARFAFVYLLIISINCLSLVWTAPCLLDDYEARQTRSAVKDQSHSTPEVPSSVETTTTTTTTESPIKKAAKAVVESFHDISQKINSTFSGFRRGRSGILMLPSSNDDSELKEILGIRLPSPADFQSLRDKFNNIPRPTLPTLPSLPNPFKPKPEMHTFGVSGLLSDGNLHDLASGR